MNRETDESRKFIDQEDRYGAHNYHPLDVVCTRGEGVFLTDVDNVCLGYGTASEKPLGDVTVPEMHAYLDAGEFGSDTMDPKVRAALRFCENRPDRIAIIGALGNAPQVVKGVSGTRIHY